MAERVFRWVVLSIAVAFTVFFVVTIVPPILESGDVLGAIAGGFVNPYATGYSTDVVGCWLVLAAWVVHEARTRQVRGGWICLLLGLVPGVVVGFAAYLVVRETQPAPAA
ncbi:MAG: DUF2834 domain-containing protein [Myxococcota bacterium]